MKPFTVAELQQLLARHESPCISIFQPLHRVPAHAREDAIRFKNLLGEAERLLATKLSAREVAKLTAPLARLVEDGPWGDGASGLAVFRSGDGTGHYSVPFELPERVVVADSFHVRPLIRYLQSTGRFFVLALSQNAVTLYEGNERCLKPLPTGNLPGSLSDVLQPDGPARYLSRHSGASGPSGGSFHGGGGIEDHKKEDLERYFRAVDDALWDALRDEHAPLVLAGVGYYHPLFRAVSRYPHLLSEGLEGHFEHTSRKDLHERAWPIVKAELQRREQAATAEAARLRGRGLSSDDLRTVAQAAVQGRVRRLLLARGKHVWGRLDRDTGDIELHESQQDADDDDVLDDIAQAVLARGGEVLLLEPERFTNGTKVDAVLRW